MRAIRETFAVLMALGLMSGALAQQANPDVAVPKLKQAPVIDGKLDEWNFQTVKMSEPQVDDLKVESANFAWDDKNLYFSVKVLDGKIINENSPEALTNADSVELRLVAKSTNGESIFKISAAPASKEGKPAFTISSRPMNSKESKQIISTTENSDKSGLKWALAKDSSSWSVEAEIPLSLLGIEPKADAKIPFVLIVWDRDRTDTDEWKEWHKRSESSSQKASPDKWPCLLLSTAEPVKVAPAPAAAPAPEKANSSDKAKPAGNAISVSVARNRPCNLFTPDQNVSFESAIKGAVTGKGTVKAELVDGFGKTAMTKDFAFDHESGKPTKLQMDFGKVPRGYYELKYTASVQSGDTKTPDFSGKSTLGVMEFANRTGAEVVGKDYRFGMKWWGGVIDKPETLDMMQKLGLQWTRDIHTSVPQMLKDAPNLVLVTKVERFPKELYDEQKYGPMVEWEKNYGKGAWTLKTLPKKEAYQKWLAEGIAQIPKDQKVFEIWNEPWDKMSPEDFATISQWIVDVILKDRPDAIIGSNLRGDMSEYEYDAKVIKAGGMKGMKMVCLHPYAGSEDRGWLRSYRKWISEKTGVPMSIYVTEYGSHSTPEGPAKRSELEQARRVVTQSLALYAEDVKALIPHWVGQSEKNPTYLEDWFGFIRRNQEAKPALVALANLARLIDSGKYLGDLWYGTGVGASMYQKDGRNILALWTLGGEKEIEIETGSKELVLGDMFGAEKAMKPEGGKLKLKIGEEVQYVIGLGADSAKLASAELRPDRFPKPAKPPRANRTALKISTAPEMDGKIEEWKGMTQLAILNPKVNGDDASAMGWLAWDDKYLYVSVDVRDNEVLNNKPRSKLYQHDSIELFISVEPRDSNPGYGPNDYQFFVTPASGEGKPIFGKLTERSAGAMEDVKGSKFFCGKANKGWTAEVAIPWDAFAGFKPGPGAKLSLDLRVNDADTSHERWKLDPTDITKLNTEDPTAWSLLTLENAK
ncbi:MAG TPA: hypothetical protein DCZ94_15645 [Lentisphaeria bacterium]|nr:MAG: hypothetical protein A2X48_16970 [Lentisphaerae bacterium GWF2_49_21]HBC88382.1 hypothetical protein [Lentisphaeria bacterium]